jgi:methylase of polypeptide subunit release factors
MDGSQAYTIGRHRLVVECRDGVGPATPYSLLLAESIPEILGQSVVDVGTGSGILAIIARLQGASRVYVLDTNPAAIRLAMENAERNGVAHGMVHLPLGPTIIPLPAGESADLIICNPAQLPLPERDRADSPFYSGRDGREMIEALIRDAPGHLSASGRLLMTHNSLTDLPASLRLIEAVGLRSHVLTERSLEFRPFINRDWLGQLGGVARGLYTIRDGRPYETVYVIEARHRPKSST